MNEINLSTKQKEIVNAEDGAIYVKASAGSGKTRVLTERIRQQLAKTKKKILALTFTNKAGEEIKERLSSADSTKDRLFIGTFHGFCQYVLENHGSSIGYSQMPHIFEDDKDRMELISQAIEQIPSYYEKYQKMSPKDKNDFNYRALDFIAKVKRELISVTQYSEHTDDENVILLYRTYEELLRVQNAIDFDDLLLKTYELFIEYPHISSLYRRSFYTICVDEAQDLNNAQYKLLIALCGDEFKNVMMVGDPKQSIFHFTGSSSKFMEQEFVKDFGAITYELKENFRSSKKVIKAANKLIPTTEEEEVISSIVYEGIFELQSCADEKFEAKCVLNKIQDLIQKEEDEAIEGKMTYEKIAILARNKYVFKDIEALLKNENIPYYYKMTPGAIKFESNAMKIFDLEIKVKINPKDIIHKQRLDIEGKDANNYINDIKQIVLDLKDDGSNLNKLFSGLKEKINNSVLQDDDEDEKSMFIHDIDELLKHWHNYAIKTDKKSLHQFKNAMALGQTHSRTEHEGITLSTVHTMKGQEFDIVFLVGMDDGTFPDYRAVKKGGIEMEQEKNNLYVAFTRAKRFLFVSYPLKRTMPWGDIKSMKKSRLLEVL